MISFERAKEIVAAITYKPGWTLTVHRPTLAWEHDINHVSVSAKVRDVRNPEAVIVVEKGYSFPAEMPEDTFLELIFDVLVVDMERHEAQEHFRYQGAHVLRPHPELAP